MRIPYEKTALLAVDIQNDFCPAYGGANGEARPEGALAVRGAAAVIAPLNALAARVRAGGGKALATQDWHPAGHISFASSHRGKRPGDAILLPDGTEQVLWPDHCAAGSAGAALHDGLDQTLIDRVFRKGSRVDIDSYSAFFENDRRTPTDLGPYLAAEGIDTLIIGGLATDYCVFYTVQDALRLGFTVYVAEDACAGIDLPPGSLDRAVKAMKEGGAVFIPAGRG
ncbi:MAG: bifunctional nicotinamidase/pyrazinamidase [Treponema sp.]|jgi:nicotinamidase/pyrazinamidase|nr:bifunctional nicotinamidase/pyrazinamidase [Treponema sp.]